MPQCSINNVEFDINYTKDERNILKVNSLKEIFFEVFECSVFDDEVITVEQTGVWNDLPLVSVEFIKDDKKFNCEAVLVEDGTTELIINEENLNFLGKIEKPIEEENEIEDKVNNDLKLEINHTYDEKIKEYEDKKFNFLNELELQFENKITNLKEDLSEKLDAFFEKLEDKKKELINEEVEDITSNLNEKFESFKSEVNELSNFNRTNIDSILENKTNEIDESVKIFLDKLTESYKGKFSDNDKKVTASLIELNSLRNKFKKYYEVNESKLNLIEKLEEKIDNNKPEDNSEKLLEFFNTEIEKINDKFNYISEEENKKYNELLASVNKKDVVEYKTILKEKIQDVELGLVKEELKKEISDNFRNELMSVKRYAEMSAGGGTNAVQYADGGTMNGNLNVNGNILSGGQNLDELFNTDTFITLQDVTDNGNTTTNDISSSGTLFADTIFAHSLLSAVNLDIGFELSGFNVTGSISASDDIYANRIIAETTLSANGNLYPTTVAGDGEVIVANGDGNLVFGHGEKLHLQIRNDEGSEIDAGTPIYSRGEIGGSERIKVGIADASDPAKMPAIGIAETTLNTSSTQDGFAIINGVYNENISGFTDLVVGRNLYVASGGGLTNVKPTGFGNLIQNIGTILKAGAGDTMLQGMKVSSIDRTNDIPNLSAKAIFYGQGDYYVQQSLSAAITDATGVELKEGGGTFTSIISSSNNLSANDIVGGRVFSGGLPVCTSAEADTLQTVTDRGNTTTTVISTSNTLSANKIDSFEGNVCNLNACNITVNQPTGQIDIGNDGICFTNEGVDVRIEHEDRGTTACNLIINASDSTGAGSTGGCLILSAGKGLDTSGGNGGDVIICAGTGHINGGNILLNACDTGIGIDGRICFDTNFMCIDAPTIRVQTDGNFEVGSGVNACTVIRNGSIITQSLSAGNGLSANDIRGERVFSGGLPVCTSAEADTLQTVTDRGNTTTNAISTSNNFNANDTVVYSLTTVNDSIIIGANNKITSDNVSNNSILGGSANCISGLQSVIVGGVTQCICEGATRSFIGNGTANRVISGDDNFIGSGFNNIICTDESVIVSGKYNRICGTDPSFGVRSFIGGGCRNVITDFARDCCASTIVGGISSLITDSKGSFIGGGCKNNITNSDNSSINSGHLNHIQNGYDESFIGGGRCNTIANGNYSSIAGGCGNEIDSIFAGGAVGSTVGGGKCNVTTGRYNVIGGGCCNTVCGGCNSSFVGGGVKNCTCGTQSVTVGGYGNNSGGTLNFIGGGKNNCINVTECCSVIGGGFCNINQGDLNFLGGGCCNCISIFENRNVLVGGQKNVVDADFSFLGGGCCNCLHTGNCAVIVGGNNNGNRGQQGFIGAGQCNCNCGTRGVIVGGFANCVTNSSSTENIIVGGNRNCICGVARNAIVNGSFNCILNNSCCNFIGNGCLNKMDAAYSSIVNGECNSVCTCGSGMGFSKPLYVTILNGCRNCICAANCCSTILNGCGNQILNGACRGLIGGGFGNTVMCSRESTILNGSTNTQCGCSSFIAGGTLNLIKDVNYSSVLGGCCNCVCHSNAFVAGTDITTVCPNMLHATTLFLSAAALPTSDPGVAGIVWRDGTDLKISV